MLSVGRGDSAPPFTAGFPPPISPVCARSAISPLLPRAPATKWSAYSKRRAQGQSSIAPNGRGDSTGPAARSRCGAGDRTVALGRSTFDLLHTLKELETWRVSVIAMNGLAFDLATPYGRMMATILAGLADFERDLLQERIRSGIAAAKARGKRLGRQPGKRPKSDRLAPQSRRPGRRRPQLSPDRVPDLVLLTVLSCPFYVVTPILGSCIQATAARSRPVPSRGGDVGSVSRDALRAQKRGIGARPAPVWCGFGEFHNRLAALTLR